MAISAAAAAGGGPVALASASDAVTSQAPPVEAKRRLRSDVQPFAPKSAAGRALGATPTLVPATATVAPACASGGTRKVVVTCTDVDQFNATIAGRLCVAFDCEGVNLSRAGSVTLVTVGVVADDSGPPALFHFDMLASDSSLVTAQLAALKALFENPAVAKIIHDCRQDADVLQHFLGISLVNVRDTQKMHELLTGAGRVNLNNTLQSYGCPINKARGGIDYNACPKYWEARPLTDAMLDYAAGDVEMLFQLWAAQKARAEGVVDDVVLKKAFEQQLDEYRGCPYAEMVTVPPGCVGKVIGRGGQTIRHIQERTATCISSCSGTSNFLILARDKMQLRRAKSLVLKQASEPSYPYSGGAVGIPQGAVSAFGGDPMLEAVFGIPGITAEDFDPDDDEFDNFALGIYHGYSMRDYTGYGPADDYEDTYGYYGGGFGGGGEYS